MAFFSKELTLPQLYKNTTFGVYTVIEELYWLINDSYFQVNKKKLEKLKDSFEKHKNIKLFVETDEKLQEITESHDLMRKNMIVHRLHFLD